MREIKYTTRFQRDYRQEKSGRHSQTLDALLMEIVNLLAADTPLPRRNFDHPLSGEWKDHRDCHIRPDLRALQAAAFWPALTAAPITPFMSLLGTTSKT